MRPGIWQDVTFSLLKKQFSRSNSERETTTTTRYRPSRDPITGFDEKTDELCMTRHSGPKTVPRRSEAFRSGPSSSGSPRGLSCCCRSRRSYRCGTRTRPFVRWDRWWTSRFQPMALSRAATSARWSKPWSSDDRSCSRRLPSHRTMRSPIVCRPSSRRRAEFHRELVDAERLLESQRESTSSAAVTADLAEADRRIRRAQAADRDL